MNRSVLPVICLVKSLYRYDSGVDGDLVLNKGDVIEVHDNDGPWWKGTLQDPTRAYGTFPSNFVEVIQSYVPGLEHHQPTRPSHHLRQQSTDSAKHTKRKPVNLNGISQTALPVAGFNDSNVSLSSTPDSRPRKNPQALTNDTPMSQQHRRFSAGLALGYTQHDQETSPANGRRNSDDSQCSATSHSSHESHRTSHSNASASSFALPGAYPGLRSANKGSHARSATADESRDPGASMLSPQSPQTLPANGSARQVSNRYSMPNLAPIDGPPTPSHYVNSEEPSMYTNGTMASTLSLSEATPSGRQSSGPAPLASSRSMHVDASPQASGLVRGASKSAADLSRRGAPGSQFEGDSNGDQFYNHEYRSRSQHALYQPQPDHLIQPSQGHHLRSYSQQQQQPAHAHHQYSTHQQLQQQQQYQHQYHQPSKPSDHRHGLHASASAYISNSRQDIHPSPDQQPHIPGMERNYRHSISNFQRSQPPYQQNNRSDISVEDMSRMDPQQPLPPHNQLGYGQGQVFNSGPLPRAPSPNIVIPKANRPRPQSAFAGTTGSTPTNVTMSDASASSGGGGSPVSASGFSSPLTPPSNTHHRRGTSPNIRAGVELGFDALSPTMSSPGSMTPNEGALGPSTLPLSVSAFQVRKPKTTLIRAFQQILNPKKVAEKDAARTKHEHFAWLEMEKSLKRVQSPEPGQELFVRFNNGFGPLDSLQSHQDPFEIYRRSISKRDVGVLIPADYPPASFVQIDKMSRNVAQRGAHVTPQVLSQRYLTRPYARNTLSKLRVLFIWISENIRLEGPAATRDLSEIKFKLGPNYNQLPEIKYGVNGVTTTTTATTPATTTTATTTTTTTTGTNTWNNGLEEEYLSVHPTNVSESAGEVLTNRKCRSGEGFANLFMEMAKAAGIEEVGVVSGYLKGPMDIFANDVPTMSVFSIAVPGTPHNSIDGSGPTTANAPTVPGPNNQAPGLNHTWNIVKLDGEYRFIDCCLASPSHPGHYPISTRPTTASSFYFMTMPSDLLLTHFPMYLTMQYVSPVMDSVTFARLPYIRPAYFEHQLSMIDFKSKSRLWIRGEESAEVMIQLGGSNGRGQQFGLEQHTGPVGLAATIPAATAGGGGGSPHLMNGSFMPLGSSSYTLGSFFTLPAIELRAEVEAMTADGKLVRKRALAQVTILTKQGLRFAKIKAVLPVETVVGPGGIRRGALHIYAGRKVENAPLDSTPYPLAMTLPIYHTGEMPKTPFGFVLTHFSPFEFYVKTPQSEILYSPHTYTFTILSLAAASSAVAANAAASVSLATSNASMGGGGSGNSPVASPRSGTPALGTASPSMMSTNGSSVLSSNLNNQHTRYATSVAASGSGPSHHHHHHQRGASYHSPSSIPAHFQNHPALSHLNHLHTQYPQRLSHPHAKPERLVLRSQSNRIYKLQYDPVRLCHEAKIDVKERGIWECVRMEEGGKRVGREGTSGVVIASWKCV